MEKKMLDKQVQSHFKEKNSKIYLTDNLFFFNHDKE